MKLQHLRNHISLSRAWMTPVVILILSASLIASVCVALFSTAWSVAAWWTALALVITIPATAVMNYRVFVLGTKVGAGFQAMSQARFTDAEVTLREALAMLTSARPDDPWRAIVCQDLAAAMRAVGNYTDAEAFGLRSLQAHEAAWGPEYGDTVTAVEELAEIYLDIARYDKAQALLVRALQAREKKRERPSVGLANCLHGLARTHFQRGEYAEAEGFARRAYDMVKNPASVSWVNRMLIRSQLVDVCANLGKFEEAELLVRTFMEETQTPGSDARLVAAGFHQLAVIRQEQKRYAESEELMRRALKVVESHESAATFTGTFLLALGQSCKAQGKWTDAAESLRAALTIMDDSLAPEHPRIATALEVYAEVLQRLGEMDQADVCIQRARQIREFHSPLRIV